MNRRMKVWFPEFFTEAHRKPGEGDVLSEELRKFGIDCQLELTEDCSFIFCGSIWKMNLVKQERPKAPNVPTIHYNWDLYPFQLMERPDYTRANPDLWDPYLTELESCLDIWVPSQCTVDRTREFVGRDAHVILSSIRPWEAPCEVRDNGYVVDVMRKYPDYNRDAAKDACKAVGIPIIETCNELTWERFKQVICECRFMISAQYEASTGGLTLLEGLWHGKPSLLSNSPRHGAVDYFHPWANGYWRQWVRFFQWDNPLILRKALLNMHDNPPKVDIDEARGWIIEQYSEYAMAQRMAKRFWELYDAKS